MAENNSLDTERIVHVGTELIDAAVSTAETPDERAGIVASVKDGLQDAGLDVTDITVKPLWEGQLIPGSDGLYFTSYPQRKMHGPKSPAERRTEIRNSIALRSAVRKLGTTTSLNSTLATIVARGTMRRPEDI